MAKNKTLVTFDGEGTVTAIPDQVTVSLTVEAKTDTSLQRAVSKQAEQKKSLYELLKQLGVENKNVSSSNYQSAPETEYDNGKHKKTGFFVATESVVVKVPVALANKVVGQSSKWAEVSGIQVGLSRELANVKREEALELAITAAEAKAAKRATRLGLTLGKIVGFNEGRSSNSSPKMYRMASLGGAESVDSNAELNEGESEVSATVTLTYKLK